jgi:hypothetical protein
MGRVKAPSAEDMRAFSVDGRTVKVMSRPADDGQLARLFKIDASAAVPVEPLSFSLPGTPDGLVMQMDDRGDGHLYAVGEDRVRLGSDGMWWIVTRIIEALEDPQTVSTWPRFLTVAGSLGGPATQAALQSNDSGICIVWRRLESGRVGELMAWQELDPERAEGWLNMLQPVLSSLVERRVHRQRLLPARTAEKWAGVLDRWTAQPESNSMDAGLRSRSTY